MDTREKHSRKNPAETTNFLNLLFFGWTAPIFWKGSRRDLQVSDLYNPLKWNESERLGDRLEREWKKELIKADQESILGKDGVKKPARQPNLMSAITRTFWAPYMLQGMLLLIQSGALYPTVPVLQGHIISYFSAGQNHTSRNQALLFAGFLVMVTISITFIAQHTNLRTQQIGMCVRVACCSMIYRKILRLDQAAVNNTAAGQVANLISNDVARFDLVPMFLHYIWIIPIQVSVIIYLMWQSVGPAALVGIGAMILQTVPVQVYLSKFSAKLRHKIAMRTDERVQFMSELISGIQVVKMYSWEKPFELIVTKIRALEMKFISYSSYIKGFDMSIVLFSEKVSLYLTLITFVLSGNTLTVEITFLLVGLFNVLRDSCALCFPRSVVMAGEAAVSLERITKFLLLDEVRCSEKDESSCKDDIHAAKKAEANQQIEHRVGVEITKVTANWVHDQVPCTLRNVSMKIRSQSLCALAGPVGSGKSSLLHLVLGELPVRGGRLSFTDEASQSQITRQDIRMSYASQDPWLFSASIRDNILFGQPYDQNRYAEVTKVCALHKDFEQLPQGDLSFVGERGASLSGGQKARVNLARAVYRDAELYLFDDPLSAVDPRVGRHLFEECIMGFLKGKTRILVTHQLRYLQQADNIVFLNRGIVECQGTYDELIKSNPHILDSKETEDPEEVECNEEIREEELEPKTTASTSCNNDQQSEVSKKNEGLKDKIDEEVATGNISTKVYWGYFSAGGNLCSLIFLAIVFIASQMTASGTDYWVTYWTRQVALIATSQINNSAAINTSIINNTETYNREMQPTESIWFDAYGRLRRNVGIYIYTGLLIACVSLVTLRGYLFVRMCMTASRNIHNSMFTNLFRATMRFFNTNPSGRILNRFSKDTGAMDELLPRAMLEALHILSVMLGIITLVTITQKWMIIPATGMCVFFYTVRAYYLKTAQDVKRLEGIAKSPMFSHVSSTLDGLTTIRSSGGQVEGLLRKEFDRHQDTHTGAWYLVIATATAFGFVLDLTAGSFMACVCFSLILLDDGNTSGGSVGLAISQSLILTGLVQYGVRQSAEVISQMTSVERMLQYTKLPKEGPFTTENPPPPTWPSKGGLVFKNVSMRYADNKPPVLKGLNVNIKPGWKVGIVGRTGAGKSSLISALFRLTGDGLDGRIFIDEIDTKSIGLHELRPRISIIPQDPILFSASLRHNLDPFEQFSDAELWDSLREVELGNVVSSLDFRVAGGGANFSVGQRQLICLARAILRNNRLLVLDEATANVDRGTDALIQNTISRRFADCTILTIAHRLNTIMDSDRVLVMKEGSIAEFGHPHLLLKNRDGHFSQMVQQTGKAVAEKLALIAETAFLISPEFMDESIDPPSMTLTDQITHL